MRKSVRPPSSVFSFSAVIVSVLMLMLAFQNCSKGGSIGSGGGPVILASSDSLPPEDQPPIGGPPSTGGDGTETTGGPGRNDVPHCVWVEQSAMNSPVADSVMFEIQVWELTAMGYIFANPIYMKNLSAYYLTFSTNSPSQYAIPALEMSYSDQANVANFLRPKSSLSDEFLFVRAVYFVEDNGKPIEKSIDLQLCLDEPVSSM